MNKIKIIGRLVLMVLSIIFISFIIQTNSGTFFHVCAAGAVIFWSVVGIWREFTGGKTLYLTRKNGKFSIEGR